jgi:hypothetical protein
MSQVLDAIKRIRTNKIGDALEKFADIVSKVESNNENVRQKGRGPGRGFYQYEMQAGSKKPQGAKTALNRYKRFLDQNKLTMPESYTRELKSKDFYPDDPDFTKLSRELQTEIFYADKQKDPDFKLADLASGTLSYQNAWLDHHWKQSPPARGPDRDREARIKHYNNEIPPLPEPRPRRGSAITGGAAEDTLTGGAAEDTLDTQMEEVMGSTPVETDPNRYYGNNLQRQLNETIPLSKLGERPLEDRELDAGLSTGTEKQERSTEAARLKRIKDMNYSREELSNRQGELGLTNEQLDELSLTPEYSDDGYVNPTEDEYLGDILRGLFEQGDAVDEVSNQGYEEPPSMAEQNLADGGPVERQVKFVKNNNDGEEEKELPDPPPGATPEEVADDIPAMLSTGEYVLPANVVRYIGLDRIVGMHKSVLHKVQQMTDLGIIQNVDHNGDPEDDDTEMDFIQEPEGLSEKKLMVIIEPKGMMSPIMSPRHFAEGGEVLSEDTLASTSDIFADGIYSTANLERAIDSPEVVESTETINAPIAFSSEPGKTAYLAYITPEEASSLRQSGQGYSAEGSGQEVLPNLYQHIGPKGLMSFNGAGGGGGGNDSNATDTSSEDKAEVPEVEEVDEDRDRPHTAFGGMSAAEMGKSMTGPESEAVNTELVETEQKEAVVAGVVSGITRGIVDMAVAANEFGKVAQEKARAAGIAFDTAVDEGDHAQGYSGFGRGVDIGGDAGSRGGGGHPEDNIVYNIEAPASFAPDSPEVYIPGLGFMSRGGIMGYHEGGTVVDDLGVVDYAEHAHEDTSVGVNYAPASYEDYTAKVFGTRLQDPAYGGKSPEDWAKSYKDTYLVDASGDKRRKKLANSLNFGEVTTENEEGGNQALKANKDVFYYLTLTQGLGPEEAATVIHNFRDGKTNIFSETSKFNSPVENEQAISFLTTLAEGKIARREGITDVDIGEGQTNRDVLKRIFAADFDGRASHNGEELISESGRTASYLLSNTADKHNNFVKNKYNVDLNAAASPNAVNHLMGVISSGGAGGKYNNEDVVAQGIMSSASAAKNKRYVEGVGVV